MPRRKRNFYNRVSQANVMSDGMLQEVSYGDFALMSALKDKPQEAMTELESDYNKELK